ALAGLVRPLPQPTVDDDAHTLLQRLGDVLRRLAPDISGEEQTFAVLPLVGLWVETTRCRGDPEIRHRGARRSEAQFGIRDHVPDDGDGGIALCHALLLP